MFGREKKTIFRYQFTAVKTDSCLLFDAFNGDTETVSGPHTLWVYT